MDFKRLYWKHLLFCRLSAAIPGRLREWEMQRRLNGKEFCVVSNNCWGGHIYKNAGIPYATPFVGVWIEAFDYLDLLANWTWVRSPLTSRSASSNPEIERIRQERCNRWPIGVLADSVEIHFMHEQDAEIAFRKWHRRAERISNNIDHIFVKFDDIEGVSDIEISQFFSLKFPNKIFFTASRERASKFGDSVYIPTGNGVLPDGWSLAKISPLYFDSIKWINNGNENPFSMFPFA